MDVEAPDDGVLAKIMVWHFWLLLQRGCCLYIPLQKPDGSSAIKVGTRIAVLAEQGDDLSALEIPAEDQPQSTASDQKPAESSSKSAPSSSNSKDSTPRPTPSTSSSPSPRSVGSDRPLYPSVEVLLHTHHLSASDIKPSGPGGRILKGDVLAHLGDIPSSYPLEVSKRLEKLSHLDLSNIKIAESKPPAPKATSPQHEEEEAAPLSQISLPVSLAAVLKLQQRLHDTLGASPPLSELLARAIALANENLPARNTPPSIDELYDDLLSPRPHTSRQPRVSMGSFMPTIGSDLAVTSPARIRKQRDVLDELISSGRTRPQRPTAESAPGLVAGGAQNVFSLAVDRADEQRAVVFLERMKSMLEVEPGRLVL
jgi:e3 binding domain